MVLGSKEWEKLTVEELSKSYENIYDSCLIAGIDYFRFNDLDLEDVERIIRSSNKKRELYINDIFTALHKAAISNASLMSGNNQMYIDNGEYIRITEKTLDEKLRDAQRTLDSI